MCKIRRNVAKTLLVLLLSLHIAVTSEESMIYVAEAAVSAPTVTASKKTLYVGFNTYKVEIKNKASKASVTYTSSNTRVATVTKGGIVKPVSSGSATITATVKQNGKSYRLKSVVTVKKPYIELTSATNYMNAGETYQFKAKANGSTSKTTWSVSDDTIASISQTGKLTAKAAGEVTVIATAGDLEELCEVSIGTNRFGVFTTNITCYEDITMYVHISEPIEKEILTADTLSKSNAILDFEWEEQTEANVLPITILPKKAGKETLVITSDQTSDCLYININVTEKPKDRKELNAKEVYAKCSPATVVITATADYGVVYTGSGFFIDNGLLVTNYHVIEGTTKIMVSTQADKEYEVKEIVGFDADIDLAVLRVDSQNPTLAMSQDGAATGEDIYALGSPFGLTGTLSDGIVSTDSRVMEGVDYIQISAPISPGNSGGPLLNVYGEVLGVNTMYLVDGQNLNFAVNIKELQKISTNRPITMKEYTENYKVAKKDKFDDKIIYEDPKVSGDPKNCQTIYPMFGVTGAVTEDEWWDCYNFKLEEPTYVTGLAMFENENDMKNIHFQIYDYNSDDPLAYGKDTILEGDPMQILRSGYLDPGEYFVAVWLLDEYVGEDVPYIFMLSYSAME